MYTSFEREKILMDRFINMLVECATSFAFIAPLEDGDVNA